MPSKSLPARHRYPRPGITHAAGIAIGKRCASFQFAPTSGGNSRTRLGGNPSGSLRKSAKCAHCRRSTWLMTDAGSASFGAGPPVVKDRVAAFDGIEDEEVVRPAAESSGVPELQPKTENSDIKVKRPAPKCWPLDLLASILVPGISQPYHTTRPLNQPPLLVLLFRITPRYHPPSWRISIRPMLLAGTQCQLSIRLCQTSA